MKTKGLISNVEENLLRVLSLCCELPIVEIGSYKGKSTLALATGTQHVYAIDPHLDGTHKEYTANIRDSDKYVQITSIKKYSEDAINDVPDIIGLLFIDGAHDYLNVYKDTENYCGKIVDNGFIVFHDCVGRLKPYNKPSPGVMKAVKEYIFDSDYWSNIGVCDSILYATRMRPGYIDYYIKRRLLWAYIVLIKWITTFMSITYGAIKKWK